MQLYAMIVKELRLLLRDIHGLALLFIMPVVFILIMSLAMKADFDRRSGVQLDVWVSDLADNHSSNAMLVELSNNPLFHLQTLNRSLEQAEKAIQSDKIHFLLTVNDKAFVEDVPAVATVFVAPGNSPELNQLFVANLREAATRQNIILMLNELKKAVPDLETSDLLAGVESDQFVDIRYAGGDVKSQNEAPTSVQQSVPAWLVFSMFFVVVPLSNTLINEKNLGTLRRMRTIDVANWTLVMGKVIPYFVINQIQVVMMLLVGMFLVPLLGGDQLALGHSPSSLVLISAALSVAALGYGILIAVISKTTEQATTLGGAGNIILAALGGVMVPTFIMPEFMRQTAVISPMSWGLQGFLDVLLRGGGLSEVWPEALALLLLGVMTLTVALLLLHRHTE